MVGQKKFFLNDLNQINLIFFLYFKKNQKNHQPCKKWKYTITKMTFWPNIRSDIPDNILMYHVHATSPLSVQGWALKGYGISLVYHGKVLEFKGSGVQIMDSCHKYSWVIPNCNNG